MNVFTYESDAGLAVIVADNAEEAFALLKKKEIADMGGEYLTHEARVIDIKQVSASKGVHVYYAD